MLTPDIHAGVSWCATTSIPLPTKTPVMTSKSTVPSTAPCWHRAARLQEAPVATSATTAVRQSQGGERHDPSQHAGTYKRDGLPTSRREQPCCRRRRNGNMPFRQQSPEGFVGFVRVVGHGIEHK